ncbi:dihydroxyacetone kinase phosphoryl donor subunit DhaM [Okibacterium fritillariae]|uniref:Phosphocarrier protein HPr n=1 Tax=Okibacterium fritillariae TaxID=123320 RepID=A0A1T5JLL0_9MICO|nr:dihydroxyacetone kinase phosphoryl donor subunit DhaM [Okibacterium fritillariae]SKC52467.1 PTS hybrid protein [Okibacterium fritillariae]
MSVGLLLVSHSSKIAEGVAELAHQMAASVTIVAAGGTDEDGIGTSFEKVQSGLASADSGDGVVVLYDLGSALLTTETAVDFLDDDDVRGRVRVVDAPLVEGAVAAAVAAEMGSGLDDVVAAARTAGGGAETGGGAEAGEGAETGDGAEAAKTGTAADSGSGSGSGADVGTQSVGAGAGAADDGVVERTVVLVNRDGLHARPAADFVKLAGSFDARIDVNGVDAQSLLAIMSLGLVRGAEARIRATGAEARRAVDELSELIETGFGED